MHKYDWVLFNDEPFSDDFKSAVTNATSSTVYFEQIKAEHWEIPKWIDESRSNVGREFQGGIGVANRYVSSSGVLKLSAEDCAPNDRAYKTRPVHPKVLAAEKKGTSTQGFSAYYRDMPTNINVPTAGIPSDKPYRPKQRMEALLAAVNGAMEDDTIMDGNSTRSNSAGPAMHDVGNNGAVASRS
ncbi:hypothetical protein E8E14_013052 [Neopestalotiopsis sp. 37M]|nr:hypothetical protein E8E14_013052 [Neopestalotiopsis sp. 37M]